MFCFHHSPHFATSAGPPTHPMLPNSVAEVISHVPGQAAQRGEVPRSLRPPVHGQADGCFVCLEGVQAKAKEPELRDRMCLGAVLCCAVPGELRALAPFPLLPVRPWPLILIRRVEEAGSARELARAAGCVWSRPHQGRHRACGSMLHILSYGGCESVTHLSPGGKRACAVAEQRARNTDDP